MYICTLFSVALGCVPDSVLSASYSRARSGLTEVPDDIPDVYQIYLNNNQITSLRNSSFVNFTTCYKLEIYHNYITHVDTGTFRDMKHLDTLSLEYNQLAVISPGMFHGLWSLRVLTLFENKISVIGSKTFYGLNSLEVLGLEGNLLSKLRPGMFIGLTSLRSMSFQRNQLKNLSPKIFAEFPRPLSLAVSDPATKVVSLKNPLQCNSRLCWLRQEELRGTITWRQWEIYIFKPECSNGIVWDTWNCTGQGNCHTYKRGNTIKLT